jgi:hypothetical protein
MFKAEKIFKILQIFIIGFNGLIIFCGWINIFSKRLLSVPVLINLLKNESTLILFLFFLDNVRKLGSLAFGQFF